MHTLCMSSSVTCALLHTVNGLLSVCIYVLCGTDRTKNENTKISCKSRFVSLIVSIPCNAKLNSHKVRHSGHNTSVCLPMHNTLSSILIDCSALSAQQSLSFTFDIKDVSGVDAVFAAHYLVFR